MLEQELKEEFNLTLKEIHYLIKDFRTPDSQQMQLRLYSAAEINKDLLAKRNAFLEQINTDFSQQGAIEITSTQWVASGLGFSRLPAAMLDSLEKYQATLTVIDLQDNNLSYLPKRFLQCNFAQLQSINLSANRLSEEMKQSLLQHFPQVKLEMANQQQEEDIASIAIRPVQSYLPGHYAKYSQGSHPGIDSTTHKLDEQKRRVCSIM